MNNFQEILDHPENEHYEKVIFLSDSATIGVVGAMNKEIHKSMTTKDILAMLKGSVPAEALSGLSWGKSITHEIDSKYKIDVALKEDKTAKIEITRLTKAIDTDVKPLEGSVKKQVTVEVDPEVLDHLMQADALIYYCEGTEEPKQLVETLSKAGYEVRASCDQNACLQSLNYKDFPIVGLVIDSNVTSNAVFSHVNIANMSSRRRQFSFLVTTNVESGNPDLAYSYSVSLVMEINSLNQFENLFTKNIQNWKRVIDPFVEVLDAKN